MKRNTFTHILSIALAVSILGLTTFASAQGGPGNGRGFGQGGQSFGPGADGAGFGQMQRGMRGPRMFAGPRFLLREDVSQEISLTEHQRTQLLAMPQPFGRGPGGMGMGPGRGGRGPGGGNGSGGPRRGGPGGPGGPGGFGLDPAEQQISQILNDAQYNRYEQLKWQFNGGIALLDPKVGEKLGLTVTQRSAIMEIARPPAPPAPGEQRTFEEMQAHRSQVSKEALALLTKEQRATWNDMLGEKFTFQQIHF
ncbi:MAG: hypothetical protein ACOCX1_03020 [Fimbriimonadaceae bacterium]